MYVKKIFFATKLETKLYYIYILKKYIFRKILLTTVSSFFTKHWRLPQGFPKFCEKVKALLSSYNIKQKDNI